jgi:hypothetical protein
MSSTKSWKTTFTLAFGITLYMSILTLLYTR